MQLPKIIKSKRTITNMNFTITKDKVYKVCKTETRTVASSGQIYNVAIYSIFIEDDFDKECGFLNVEGDMPFTMPDLPTDQLYKYFYTPDDLRRQNIDTIIDNIIDGNS